MTMSRLLSLSYLHLLLLMSNLVHGHWICDLAQVSCNASSSSEMCFVQNMNAWHDPTSAEVVSVKKKRFCALKCIQEGCLCALYDNDQNQCFLAYGEIPSASSSGLLEDIGENVALEKPVYSSSEYTHPKYTHYALYAVDGKVSADHKFFHSKASSKPWLLVDLSQPFQIKAIKLICRLGSYSDNRFLQVAVMFGNTLTTDGDFSTYTVATVVPGPNPGPQYWLFLRLSIPGEYRYVVLQRQATTGSFYLEIGELEIYA